ncbi:hypothetical protein BGV40_02750 [Methanosarcina sp. Ant1]|nr:hypothetical protein BGV40_02750 [Methanosarcina sp. Ant1]
MDNPNDIFIFFTWDTKENATRFLESEELKKQCKAQGWSANLKSTFLRKSRIFRSDLQKFNIAI